MPLARPAQAKIQMLTTSSQIFTILLKILRTLGISPKMNGLKPEKLTGKSETASTILIVLDGNDSLVFLSLIFWLIAGVIQMTK